MKEHSRVEMIKYRLETSKKLLDEVPFHIQKEFWNTATNRMYYACFQSVSALLVKHKIRISSHKGARIQFFKHFVKSGIIDQKLGRAYSVLFQNRHSGDYTDYFDNTENSVKNIYPLAQELIHSIKNLIEE